MAPGGFSEAILQHASYNAKVYGVTLDVEQGGLRMLLDENLITGLCKFDITHLYSEYTNQVIPRAAPTYRELCHCNELERLSSSVL